MKTIDLVKKYRHTFGTDYTQDANCQAAYLFTEGSGVTVADSSQNSHTGNFLGEGQPAWSALVPAAYAAGSVKFDGSNDYINCGNSAALNIGNDYTSLAWDYNPAGNAPKHGHIFGRRAGSEFLYALFIAGGNNVEHRLTTNTGQYTLTRLSPDDQWNHRVIVRSGTTLMTIYLNGVSVASRACAGTASTGTNILMGAAAGNEFNNKVTEFAEFNRNLDSTEINDIMDDGLVGAAPAVVGGIMTPRTGYWGDL